MPHISRNKRFVQLVFVTTLRRTSRTESNRLTDSSEIYIDVETNTKQIALRPHHNSHFRCREPEGLWNLRRAPLQRHRAMLCTIDLRCAQIRVHNVVLYRHTLWWCTMQLCTNQVVHKTISHIRHEPSPRWCTMLCCQSSCADRRTDRCYQTYYLHPMWSIKSKQI